MNLMRAFGLLVPLLSFSAMAASASDSDGLMAPIRAGSEIVVSPGGRSVVQQALDRAGPGVRVRLRPGVYNERISIRRSGTAQAPLILEGDPGAILDGSTPWSPQWQPADDIGPGVYRAKINFQPATLIADDKYIPAVLERYAKPSLFVQGITHKGQRDADFKRVGALWMYISKKREVIIRFHGNKDPSKMKILAAPKEPVIAIRGAKYCVVRGLVIKNAHYGVLTENAQGIVIEYNTIYGCDHGAWLDKETHRSIVRRCDISLGAIFDTEGGGNVYAWIAFKTHGYKDRRGIQLRSSGNGNEIAYNYVHDTHDGIETKSDAADPAHMQDTDIHHNLVMNTLDDPLSPNAGEVNCRWHHNVMIKGWGGMGMRIKHPIKGPLYIYRNLFKGTRAWCFKKSAAEVYFYHNTVHHNKCVQWTDPNIPRFHFINNVFLATRDWDFARGGNLPRMPSDHVDYNLYVGPTRSKTGFEQHGLGVGSVQQARVNMQTFQLQPSSPAIDRGTDLSTKYGKALPGCESGYFKGVAPDVGAFEFGGADLARGVDPKKTGAFARAGGGKITVARAKTTRKSPAKSTPTASNKQNGAAAEKFRKEGQAARPQVLAIIVSGVKSAGAKTVYIDFGGRAERARIVAASDERATFSLRGQQMTMDWNLISPRRLGGIAAKYAANGAELLTIAGFLFANGEKKSAGNVLDRARELGLAGDERQQARLLAGFLQ